MSEQYPLKKNKIPWPTKKAMEQVYEMKLWGSGEEMFYSGDGSHISKIVEPYKQAVISFLNSFTTPITVCDFGCGDFNIGKDFVKYTQHYKAVDIVAPLIKYNKQKYQEENLTFYCLDLAVDELPKGDCAIVRQVLQHLSNKEVQAILDKLTDFKYIILTEHIPVGDFIPNQDIISGQGIRIKKQSGLEILKAPFCFQVKETKELCSVMLSPKKGRIVTYLYKVF